MNVHKIVWQEGMLLRPQHQIGKHTSDSSH